MPEKTVNVRAITFLGVVDVRDGNEPVRGKLLHELDDVSARDVKPFTETVERRPRATPSPRKIGQVCVELLGLFGDFRALLRPSRYPDAMKEAVGIDKSATRSSGGWN
jgi:hypothetical protein